MQATREIPAKDRDTAIASLARMLAHYLPGKALEVTIRQRKAERSDLQNRALWGVAYKALREQTGNDPDDLHQYFCGEHFGWVEHKVMGRRALRPRRTTTRAEDGTRDVIRTTDMADFYDFVQMRAAENGYDVPDPDPEWWREEA